MNPDSRSPNPYAPPVAVVADIADIDVAANTPFFAVSPLKFAIMSLGTLGLYEYYWFYKHWALVSRRQPGRVMPVARAVFAILFCYPFMAEVRRFRHPGVPPRRLPAALLTIGWIGFTLTQRLDGPYWLLSVVSWVFLLPVQERVNEINSLVAPGHHTNDRLSGLNWIAVLAGGSLTVLLIVDLFTPL